MEKSIHIVLIEPEIPQNTGNIGRTCVALGAPLHFIGRLGFSLEEKDIRRAGLDYWDHLEYTHDPDWETFLKRVPAESHLFFLSTKGERSIWDLPLTSPCYLVFGSESRGLPPSFYQTYKDRLFRIPMVNGTRSLNLGTSVGVAAYEAARAMKIKI